MADAKISQLPVATTPLAGTELVPVVQTATTKQTTVDAVIAAAAASGTVVASSDVGTAPNQIPLNQYLGTLAYQDSNAVNISGGAINAAVIGETTPAAGTFTTLNTTGNVTLGDASTDTVRVNGYMGVGGIPSADTGIYLTNTALTGTAQVGVLSSITGSSSATTRIVGFNALVASAAASFTVADLVGFRASTLSKGAGSTVTNTHGVLVLDQTQGTNNFGITSQVSSGANKWNIYASGTAANYFAGLGQFGPTVSRGVGSSVVGQIQAETTGNFQFTGVRNSADNIGGILSLGKSRVAAVGGTTIVQDGDMLGQIRFAGADGVNLQSYGATVSAHASGTIGAGVMPGDLRFATTPGGAGAPIERLRIDSSGNLGLGVTPSAWATYKAFQMGATTPFALDSSGGIGLNYYYDGAYKYVGSSSATVYSLAAGQHRWFTAPSGTAGNPITFTERAKISATEMVVNEPGEDYDFRVESDTNTHALFVDAGNSRVGINNSSPTVALDITGDLKASGNTTLGDASTDTVRVNGYMGVGNAANSVVSFYIQGTHAGTDTALYANRVTQTVPATTTGSWFGFANLNSATAASAFTLANAYHYYANNLAAGAGSTITSQHGLFIADLTSATNNYGIVSQVSSGSNKWNIYASGTAANYFAGNVGIGTTSPSTKLQIEASNTGAASELLTVYNSGTDSGTEARIKLAGGNGLSTRYAYISAINNGASAGNGHSLVFATNANAAAPTERLRIDSSGNLIQTVNTTAATLTTNQTLTFSIVDNSTLRISVRGSDGTTRTATIALT